MTVLADHHDVVCRQLAGPVEQRFERLAVTTTQDGAALLEDGLARFDCTIYREVEAGDQTIVLLELHGVETAQLSGAGTSSPLVFHRSGFGRLAG
ncbi:hypothetical protein JCM10369A_00290 [Nocardioides pyridinolyticus]